MTEEIIIAPLIPVSLRAKRGNLGGGEDMRLSWDYAPGDDRRNWQPAWIGV